MPAIQRANRRRTAGRNRWWWSAGTIVAAAAVVIGLVAVSGGGDGGTEERGVAADAALGVSFVHFDGSSDTLERYVGQPLVVNFFASWCTPCLAELPEFEQVHQSLEGDVTFVGLNLSDTAESGLAVVAQTGITYDVARDPDGLVFTAFEAFAMPTTVFIDATGQVVQVWSGQLTGEMLVGRIEELLV